MPYNNTAQVKLCRFWRGDFFARQGEQKKPTGSLLDINDPLAFYVQRSIAKKDPAKMLF